MTPYFRNRFIVLLLTGAGLCANASCVALKKKTPATDIQPMPQPGGVYFNVEEKPRYEGNLKAFLEKNRKYPKKSLKNNVQGQVIVKFDVMPDGTVRNAVVIRGLDKGCNKEAIRLIRLTSGSWKPAYKAGKAISSTYTYPIVFKLNDP